MIYTLFFKEKNKVQESVDIRKDKRCGKLREEPVHTEENKKSYIQEGDSVSLPTIYLEALFCKPIIYAPEGYDVAIFYIMGAYLNEQIPKHKIILMNISFFTT